MPTSGRVTDQRAIIDIGSNTVRLVVYGGQGRSPYVVLNEKVTAKLGREVGKTGQLSNKAMTNALKALARFAALLKLMSVRQVDTVATAAVRDAANGPQFLEAVARLGLSPRLLSGEEEARTSAMGVIAAFPGANGMIGDLGGGSLELVTIADGGHGIGVSLPFGTLQLPEMRALGPARFAALVRRGIKASGWTGGTGEPFYLVGGSWRAFALCAMEALDWPIDDPHGFEISTADALRLCRSAAQGKLGAMSTRISPARRAALPHAAALLGTLIREIRPSRIVASSWGLREGLLFQQLDTATRSQDPLITGMTTFAEPHDVSAATATMVTGWTTQIGTRTTAAGEGLRLAATMLALAVMRSEPNLRASEAMEWALRKRWIGVDSRGKAMLAAAVLANIGRTEIPAELARLAPEADLREAIGWGLAVRLCRKLTGCAPQALSGTALTRDGERLVLSVDGPLQALLTDNVAKNLTLLASWLQLEPVVDLRRQLQLAE